MLQCGCGCVLELVGRDVEVAQRCRGAQGKQSLVGEGGLPQAEPLQIWQSCYIGDTFIGDLRSLEVQSLQLAELGNLAGAFVCDAGPGPVEDSPNRRMREDTGARCR